MIKLYRHWVKFIMDADKEHKEISERSYWHPNIHLAKKRMVEDVESCRKCSDVYPIIDYGIMEDEFPSKIFFCGELRDLGEHEVDVYVGDKSLYNELYSKFFGNKVRLTFEILHD